MSNVFLSAAIRLCCDARATPQISVRRLFGSLQYSNASRRTSLIDLLPRRDVSHQRIIIQAIARPLSTGLRLQAKRKRETPATPSFTLPSSNLEPPTTVASHTEGVLDTEEWRNYDSAGGLPLPDGELSEPELTQVFEETNTDVDTGNYILSVMHWRRMSGALIDIGIQFPKDMKVSPLQAHLALEYLRSEYPNVDEQELGTKWAEEESQKMRQELQDRAVALGLYKPIEKSEEEYEEEEEQEAAESQQGTEYGRARSGKSAVDGLVGALRANAAERIEKKEMAIAQKERSLLHAARGPLELAGGVQRNVGVKRYGTYDVVLRAPDSLATLETAERKPWVKYYEQEALLTKEEKIPQLSTVRRLAPSLLVMLLTLGFCLFVSDNYTPPPTSARLWPDTPPAVATLGGITIVMCAFFILGRLPPFWRTNNKFFCIVPAYPYAISNIGAIFRHDTLGHLTTNLVTLWLIGLTLHEEVGRGTFLAIFLGAGTVGTYSALLYNVASKHWTTWIFGSSGAVLGVLGALGFSRPSGTVSILGYELPMAAWLLLTIVGATEVVSILRRKKTNLDHAGHLGGLISGVAAAAYLRSKYAKEKEKAPVMTKIEQ